MQRGVVIQFPAARLVRQGFRLLLAFQIPLQRLDGVASYEERNDDAHDVANIASVAWQVRNQFHKKGDDGEENETPYEWPIGRRTFFREKPASGDQKRQLDILPRPKGRGFLLDGDVPPREC